MNLSNKYIAAEDIESVEQLRGIFLKAQNSGYACNWEATVVGTFEENALAYVRFEDDRYGKRLCWGMSVDDLPDGYTRIKPADILEPDYYSGEWIDWPGGDEPPVDAGIELEFRDGVRQITQFPEDYRWQHRGRGDDIIRFRVLNRDCSSESSPVNPDAHFTDKEGTMVGDKRVCHSPEERCMGCPHYWGKADECAFKTEGHPRAPLLREIVDEAEVNPEFWKAFRVRNRLTAHHTWHGEWFTTDGENLYRYALDDDYEIERKPHTIHLSGDVPEDVIEHAKIAYEKYAFLSSAPEFSAAIACKALLDLSTGADE